MSKISPIPLNPIAEALKRQRLSLGLTQRQVAILADVSRQAVINIEAGLVPKRGTALNRIQSALDAATNDPRLLL